MATHMVCSTIRAACRMTSISASDLTVRTQFTSR